MYARIGRTFSPVSGQEVRKHSTEDILNKVMEFGEGTSFMILAPFHVISGRTAEKQLEMYLQEGYTRIMTGGEVIRIEDLFSANNEQNSSILADLEKNISSTFLVIDRLRVSKEKDDIARLTDSAESAMYEGDGACRLIFLPSNIAFDFSSRFEADGMTFEEPNDNMFSFNSPMGACPTCEGFGSVIGTAIR